MLQVIFRYHWQMDTWGKTWRCLPGSCGRWPTSPGRGPVRPAGWFLEGGGHHHSPFQRNQLHILDQRRMIWTPVRFRIFHLRWDTWRCQFYLRSYVVQLTRKSCPAGFWREGRHCFLSSGDERKRMKVKWAMVNMSLEYSQYSQYSQHSQISGYSGRLSTIFFIENGAP